MNLPFLNHFIVTQGSVLIIDKENPLSLLQERFRKLGTPEDAPIYFLQNPDYYKLQDEKHLKWTINFIKENDIKLVILDSFVHIHKGDENDSQAIAAEVESHLAVDQINNTLKIAQYKNRRGELIKPFSVNPITTEDSITFQYNGIIEEEVEKSEKARFHIIELLQKSGELTRKTITETLSEMVGRDSIDKAIKKMEINKEIISRLEGRNKYIKLSPDYLPESGDTTISSLEQSYLEEID